ncbi:MAG TPA: dTDP-4-dehydrorhamnose reductase [Candidatus Competibacter sp.]|nr:dTDP-4-dehydrorhamnose reductase [Candidatus Competibacteraceae bacterium]HAO33894.1 dTDP-4-dehydrorhamnose reductase [Candidatus Competibacteraceae bacterium]HRE53939.1 dTDP-4-dehydrorhamnose reductase [Candidatus Competibacter sp.]HUM95161.1 dTDP-4-dehydrorhamnose reductase [Candidatus Competibacter sp.]
MRLAIIGAKGQVGWELSRRAPMFGHEVLAWDVDELDIRDAGAVDRMLADSGADAVINAAAYTAVDRAEQEPEQAFAVNRDGPAHLAAACARSNIPLLHISTDYIFDGTKSEAYTEDDPAAPLGVYGRSKWEGDEAVRRLLPRHLILRVSWVFGVEGENFVKTILRLAREREELRVVADQRGRPSYAGDIADVLVELAGRIEEIDARKLWGVYHYGGEPATTWYEFATAIVERARPTEDLKVRAVTAITTADYPTPAARPANSVLDCSRLGDCFSIYPASWRESLSAMLFALHGR